MVVLVDVRRFIPLAKSLFPSLGPFFPSGVPHHRPFFPSVLHERCAVNLASWTLLPSFPFGSLLSISFIARGGPRAFQWTAESLVESRAALLRFWRRLKNSPLALSRQTVEERPSQHLRFVRVSSYYSTTAAAAASSPLPPTVPRSLLSSLRLRLPFSLLAYSPSPPPLQPPPIPS